MSAEGGSTRRSPGSSGHTFKLLCAKCNAAILCEEKVIDTGGACPKCMTPINAYAYPPLAAIIERREAEARAQAERERAEREAEREARRAQREHEQMERDRQRAEEADRRAAEAEKRREALAAMERKLAIEQAEQAKRDAEAQRERILNECLAPHPIPSGSSLRAGQSLFSIIAIVQAVVGAFMLLGVIASISRGNAAGGMLGVVLVPGLFASLFSALVCWALSGVFYALHEIMLGTWRQATLLQKMLIVLNDRDRHT